MGAGTTKTMVETVNALVVNDKQLVS